MAAIPFFGLPGAIYPARKKIKAPADAGAF